MLSHLSSASLPLKPSTVTATAFLRLSSRNLHFSYSSCPIFSPFFRSRPSLSFKLSRSFHFRPGVSSESAFSPSRSMEASPSADAAATVESLADGLRNQRLGSENRVLLRLEDLNWDHSFVHELPGDPRTDPIPRQVRI